MPKFSIIIPTHNGEDRIRTCLDSVKNQTYKDYELIVVCDACTDDTKAVARDYGAKVIETNCANSGGARNAGLEAAKGEWVLWLDDDDYWIHEYVLEQIAGKVGLEDEDILCFSFIFKGWKYASPTGNQGNHWIAIWNKCWKRSFIGDTRFPLLKHDDAYFHRDMFNKNPKIVDWDMPMYYYNYMRPGSYTWQYAHENSKEKADG